MKSISSIVKAKPWVGWLIFFITVAVVFLLGLLASSITERRAEAGFAYTPRVEHTQLEPRNEVWGQNFPREYQSYLKTRDTNFRTKYNGSAMIDMLETDPRLVILWAGYGFSKDYNQGRGHNYAVTDIINTLRTGAPVDGKTSPMPNTCWACKSPDVPRLMDEIGVAEFYKGTWETKGHEIVNPIGCADCHDAETMNLAISRPALIEAFERMGKDIKKASHQEMRSLVCAQCHVEYYFNKYGVDTRSLRYPGLISYKTEAGGGTTDYAVEIFYEAIKNGRYECFLGPETALPMMFMPDAIHATIDLMEADSARLSLRSSYNIAGMCFTPTELAAEIKKHIPGFEITYKPDFRQAIADSWPACINDAVAKRDWGLHYEYDLARMTEVMLTEIGKKLKG